MPELIPMTLTGLIFFLLQAQRLFSSWETGGEKG